MYDLITGGKDVGIETNMVKGYKDILVWYNSIIDKSNDFLEKYRVVFSYTFVEFCENIERIEKRFQEDIGQYLKEYILTVTNKGDADKKIFEDELKRFEETNNYKDIKSAPRLPETDIPTFKNKFNAILNSIKENQKCLQTCDVPDHVYRTIDQRILIFNNNTNETSPIYDSDLVLKETSPIYNNDQNFNEVLNNKKIYESKDECKIKGGRRTPRKTRRIKKKQKPSRNKRRKTRCRK